MKYGWRWNNENRQERDTRMLEMRRQGKTHAEIGCEFAITSQRVSQIMKILDRQSAKQSDAVISEPITCPTT